MESSRLTESSLDDSLTDGDEGMKTRSANIFSSSMVNGEGGDEGGEAEENTTGRRSITMDSIADSLEEEEGSMLLSLMKTGRMMMRWTIGMLKWKSIKRLITLRQIKITSH